MNLLLLTHRDRVDDRDSFRVDGRRARHLIEILGVQIGQFVRTGLIDGALAQARITAIDTTADRVQVTLAVDAWGPTPARPRDVLVLAVPRPKALRRMLAAATALGFGQIHLTRAWKVEKSHLSSRVLAEDALRAAMLDGLEQGRRTHLPDVAVHTRFATCMKSLREAGLPAARWVAHPGPARARWPHAEHGATDLALALGPDGGWIEREVGSLGELGFAPLGLGNHPLRTETALAAAWGHLDLLRRQATDQRQ